MPSILVDQVMRLEATSHDQIPISPVSSAIGNSSGWEKNGCRSEEHTSELQSRVDLVCRLLLEKKNPDARTRLMRRLVAKQRVLYEQQREEAMAGMYQRLPAAGVTFQLIYRHSAIRIA